jgi:hypothetical protein
MTAMSEQPGRYERSFSGMVGAMVVLVLVVAGFVIFREVNRNDPVSPVKALDITQSVEFAREEARFPLLAPAELPEGWIATSVRFQNGRQQSWHLGMLTEDEKYVGLEQERRSLDDMVEEHVDEEAERGDDVVVDGQTWQTFTDEDDDLALVRETPEVTTLLVGRVSQETFEELLATLE